MRVEYAERLTLFGIAVLWMSLIGTAFTEEQIRKTPHLYESPEQRRDVANIKLGEGVSVGGLIEAEVSVGKENGETVSDIVIATFELGVEAEFSELVQGRALLLWDEDDTEPVDLDEVFVVLRSDGDCPVYLKVGKFHVPFGAFNSHFISDPLTLELAETRESAVLVGFENDLIDISAGVFNGEADENNIRANDMFAALTLNFVKELQVGVNWISDIGESDCLQEYERDSGDGVEVEGSEYNRSAGAGASISI